MRIRATLRRIELTRQKEEAKAQSQIDKLRQQILSNITHELRTPISLLLQTLSMSLQDRFKNNPTAIDSFLKSAINNAHELQTISNDLIMLTQLDEGIVNDFRQVLDLSLDFYPLIRGAKQRWESKGLKFAVTVSISLSMRREQDLGRPSDISLTMPPNSARKKAKSISSSAKTVLEAAT